MTPTLLVLLLRSQAERPDDPPAGAMEPPLPAALAGGWHYLTRVEDSGLALLPSGGAEGLESYAQLTPMLVLDGGEELGVNLGAPVRPRVGGGAPGAGWVRREDWDSLSDWGQLVRALKLGSDSSPVGLWTGALDSYSLLSALAAGVGKPQARFLYSGEVRWRFGGWLYAVGQGGTRLFAAPDGTLRPGAFASAGLGVDHAR